MKFEHKITVEATPEKVGAFLDDIEKAAACVPGLEEIKPLDDDWYEGRVGIRIGPFGMHFNGKARMEKPTPGLWRMHGEGHDRRVGSGVKAAVDTTMNELKPGTTELNINADVNFSGRLAELGQPLIKRKADSMVQDFAKNLRKALEEEK